MTIRSCGRLEAEGNAVVAEALSGGFGAVIEHMALVTTTATAVVFGAGNDQLEIYLRGNRSRQSLPEAGPAGATVELGLGREQRQVTAGAMEGSRALFVIQRAREGRFCALPDGARDKPLEKDDASISITELPGTVFGLGCRKHQPGARNTPTVPVSAAISKDRRLSNQCCSEEAIAHPSENQHLF